MSRWAFFSTGEALPVANNGEPILISQLLELLLPAKRAAPTLAQNKDPSMLGEVCGAIGSIIALAGLCVGAEYRAPQIDRLDAT